MQSRIALPLCVLVLALQSCATRTPSLLNRSISSDEVHEIVHANQDRMQTATGEGTISVETTTMAQSGSFTLTLRKPDSLLVNLSGPFGIKVGSALLTRTNFWFYSGLENRLYSGDMTPQNLSRILRLNITFDDLLSLFTGGVFLQTDAGAPDDVGIEDDHYTFLYKSDNSSHKYFIDPQSLLISKIQYLDNQGKLLFEQRFVNFQTIDSAQIPFNIRIVQPKERRMVSVVYSDLTINTKDLEFTFVYPPNAERVRWQ